MRNSERACGRPDGIEVAWQPSAGRPTARYVSETTVREEALEHGRLIGLYWSAVGQVQRENVTAALPRGAQPTLDDDIAGLDPLRVPLHVFELEIDGQSLHNHWAWCGAFERDGGRPGTVEAVVELKHRLRPIHVRVVTRLDGTAFLARWLEITNAGDAPAALGRVAPWSGALWNTHPAFNTGVRPGAAPYTLGYLRSDRCGHEGDFRWQDLPPETFRILRNHDHPYSVPTFVLRNNVTGEACMVALAWSGNWQADFTNRPATCLTFSVGPAGPAPLRVIAPGETVLSPEVHAGPVHGDLDALARAWRRHMRASVLPPRPAGREMYTVAARVVEEPGDWIVREIDIAAEMGCEAFMVDAGWYGDTFAGWTEQRGDWHEGDWLPGGIAGLRRHTHERGMLFGLWMEPETVSERSNLARTHPEWLLTTDDGRRPGALCLNLGNPDAARHFEESVLRVVRDFELDFYKMDYNQRIQEGGQNTRDGFAEHAGWRHHEVLYGVYDRILREHPDVVLENCAGGGARLDIGLMSRMHYACESDYSTYPNSIRAINTLSLFLPPEAICYYHNHMAYAHHTADLDTHLRVALFATPIFVGFGAQDCDRGTAYYARTRRTIELARTFCRPILANRAEVHHHTPDIGLLEPAPWCVLEIASPDASAGYAGIFRLSAEGPDEWVYRPRGLDAARTYEVTLDSAGITLQLPGWELASRGLPIRLPAPLTSELVMARALQ